MIAKSLNAKVIAIDINDATLQKAEELNADFTINSLKEDPIKRILELTNNHGADVSVDALGSEITANQSINSLKRRGKHIQLGLLLTPTGTTPVPMARAIAYELDLLGSHGMAAKDYPGMLKLITDGKLKPQDLITNVVSLEDGAKLLKDLDKSQSSGVTILSPTK
jgi:alcohol dehydrogenase